MSLLHLSTGNLANSSAANCSNSSMFKGCLQSTAVLRSRHTVGFWWDSDLDSLLATPEQSSVSPWTIPGCFLTHIWGRCPTWRTMTFNRDPVFWHWVEYWTSKYTDNLLISWCLLHVQGPQYQRQQNNLTALSNLPHVWLLGRCHFLLMLHLIVGEHSTDNFPRI